MQATMHRHLSIFTPYSHIIITYKRSFTPTGLIETPWQRVQAFYDIYCYQVSGPGNSITAEVFSVCVKRLYGVYDECLPVHDQLSRELNCPVHETRSAFTEVEPHIPTAVQESL